MLDDDIAEDGSQVRVLCVCSLVLLCLAHVSTWEQVCLCSFICARVFSMGVVHAIVAV